MGKPENRRPPGIDAAEELSESGGEPPPGARDELADENVSFVR